MNDDDNSVITTGVAARMVGLSIQTVIRMVDDGSVRGFRVPGSTHRRILLSSLREYCERHGIPLRERPGAA